MELFPLQFGHFMEIGLQYYPLIQRGNLFVNNVICLVLFLHRIIVFISLHERFHAFQMRWLQDDFKTLFKIPTFNSPPESREEILFDIDENSVQASLCIQKQYALYQAYIENDVVKSKRVIAEFLRYRNQRMLLMNEKEIETENYMELIEGPAQYIEFRLAETFSE